MLLLSENVQHDQNVPRDEGQGVLVQQLQVGSASTVISERVTSRINTFKDPGSVIDLATECRRLNCLKVTYYTTRCE